MDYVPPTDQTDVDSTDKNPSRGAPPPGTGPAPSREAAAPLALSAADILENVSDAVVALDRDWRILYANREACRINRKPPEEFVGKVHWDEWPAAVGTDLERHLRRAMAERVVVHFEHRYVFATYDVWLEVDVYPSDGGINLLCRDVTARKRAEEELGRSEERYRSLVEATAEIVWTNSPEGEMRGPQPGWGGFTGQTEAEYRGFGWARAVHPEDAQPTIDAWNAAVAARRPFLFEQRVRRHDGVYRTFAIRAVPVLEEDGTVREWVGVHTDVTEQRQAEETSGERTRLLALSADVGRALTARQTQADMLRGCAEALVQHLHAAFARVWVLDEAEDVLVLRASAGQYTHLDGPHGRVPVGQFKIGLIAQERRPHLTNALGGDSRVSDQDWVRREGMVAFAGHPLVVDDHLIGVVALFARRPLTEATLQALGSVADEIAVGIERVRTEEALRESEARKGAIQMAALDSIIKMDDQGRIIEWNPAAERTFGYTRAQAVGQSLRELIIPLSLRGAHQRGLAHFLATGEGPILNRRIEVSALRADGTEFPAELAVVPVALRGRTLFIAYLRDLTERDRAAAQQRAFLRDVLLSVTEGRLHLCHSPGDLPAPLTPVGGPVALSRESGLRELRRLALDAAEGMAEEGRHDLATAVSEAGMNAVVHAGGGEGQVSVGADRTVQVRVEDQGAGITMENLPRAALSRGFSTKATLGHGLKMMIETADRLYLLTGPGGTTVVLEKDREEPLPAWL
jgi:PAS domain S-box-containing protein